MRNLFCKSHPAFIALVGVCLVLAIGIAADVVEDLAFEWSDPVSADAQMVPSPESDDSHLPSARHGVRASQFGQQQLDLQTVVSLVASEIQGTAPVHPVSVHQSVSWPHSFPPSHGLPPLRI
jgi:hypothetical protein